MESSNKEARSREGPGENPENLEKEISRYLTLLERLEEEVGDKKLATRLLQEIGKDMRMEKMKSKSEVGSQTEKKRPEKGYSEDIEVKELNEKQVEELIGDERQSQGKYFDEKVVREVQESFLGQLNDSYTHESEYMPYPGIRPESVARQYRGVV
ncbi:hypothetical protein AKJ51_00745 [candidate division MSBL1 archaeon SCGC-AAA382A20]|uniref:Uncharacterized protein n=1 Tax=candidate division MSBL1 archaeon SCGC-AAA382A20 TaxID=1698280 RepID=A0A133VMH0_9EURY|nr:hypothetical protein AKJ51_00745 [candidate division MSBL1 archaeon SCGC-AAA382A20]